MSSDSSVLPNQPRRRASLRESLRNLGRRTSVSSLRNKGLQRKNSTSSSYHPYSVFEQAMLPPILREGAVTERVLEALNEGASGRRSLSRVARTSQAMNELAIPIMWRELDNLIPIVGLFPSSILKRSRRPGMGLSRAPQEGDWGKIAKYGAFVHRIGYDELSSAVAPTIFAHLSHARPMPWILPNLRHLSWRASTPAGLDRALLFTSPALSSFSLELTAKVVRLDGFLRDVAAKTSLREFSLTAPTALSASFVDVLLPQTKLQKLVLAVPEVLSSGLGRWAAALPELKSLQLDLRGQPIMSVEAFFEHVHPRSGDSTPSSFGSTDSGVFSGSEAVDVSDIRKAAMRLTGDLRSKTSFAELQHLHLTGDAASVSVFLRHISSAVTQLDLVIEDPPERAEWEELCSLVCEKYHSSLSTWRVSATPASKYNDLARSPTRTEPPTHRVSLEHLGPLPALQRFEVDLPESVLFNGADILQLASMCPNLEEVKLCPLARFSALSGAPKLTLDDLSPLMTCAHLHTVYAVVNATGRSKTVAPSRQTSSDSLRRLHLGHSWISDPLQVAILLSHFAPRLETLRWFHEKTRPGFVEANSRGWQAVQDTLPHLQAVRLQERQAIKEIVSEAELLASSRPPKTVAPVVVETREKSVGASVISIDRGVLARPRVSEATIQVSPLTANRSVDAVPQVGSKSVEASIMTSDVAVDASVQSVEQGVEASVQSAEQGVEASVQSTERGIEAKPQYFSTGIDAMEIDDFSSEPETPTVSRRQRSSYTIPSAWDLLSFAWRLCVTFPLSIPSRILTLMLSPIQYSLALLPGSKTGRSARQEDGSKGNDSDSSSDSSEEISMEVVNDTYAQYGNMSSLPLPMPPAQGPERELSLMAALVAREPKSPTEPNRRVTELALNLMSDNKKPDKDFTAEVDAALAAADALIKGGKRQEGLDKLFALEKQTRNAADLASTKRLVKTIIEYYYDAQDFSGLNATITLLSKKHGQLKNVIQDMVENVITWLDDVKTKHGTEKWLELLETLRGVTEGKIFLETPRARVTLLLSHHHESVASSSKDTSEASKSMEVASELLSELQVETYSSMERREKTEFILEQMRLLIAVAQRKDTEAKQQEEINALGGGEAEWVKARVGSRKVSEPFLKEKENEDLKLKFYDLMIQYSLHHTEYLEVANHYYKVWETPSVKEDVKGKGQEALEHIVYYVVLAPHSNEQSDLLHRLYTDPALASLELQYNFLKSFTTPELMRWPGIREVFGSFLQSTPVFSNKKRWDDLHTRVVEHNIRVISKYYTRIRLSRLTLLLDLTAEETEETLARLVVSGTVWARIDRPSGIVNFKQKQSAEDVMNEWSSDMQKLLGLVEKTWMNMNAAMAAQSRVKAGIS